MKKVAEYSQMGMKTCSLCNKSSEAEGTGLIHFGEWMVKKEICVHYYCLLLSTNLPQRGEDHSGILGFRLRDIRLEMAMAKRRKCKYCFEKSATIQCFTCKQYFHLTCGHTSKCLSQFAGDFKSYCHACVPVDKFLTNIFARKPPLTTEMCFVCVRLMGSNSRWIYAKCCGNGYIHSKCMKIYALSAGYYLTCIWCKDKRFREDIKYLGIFVPDRDANWEREKGAYVELYQGHRRCDMEICNCPKGRYYTNSSKWKLIICKLCGAFGAHNPICIPGFESSKEKLQEFKCDVCSVTEQTVINKFFLESSQDIDTSLYVSKAATTQIQSVNTNDLSDTTLLQEKIINGSNSTPEMTNSFNRPEDALETAQIEFPVYTLTQSPQVSQQLVNLENAPIRSQSKETLTQSLQDSKQLEDSETCPNKIKAEGIAETDVIAIANLLVQKMFDILEVNN